MHRRLPCRGPPPTLSESRLEIVTADRQCAGRARALAATPAAVLMPLAALVVLASMAEVAGMLPLERAAGPRRACRACRACRSGRACRAGGTCRSRLALVIAAGAPALAAG